MAFSETENTPSLSLKSGKEGQKKEKKKKKKKTRQVKLHWAMWHRRAVDITPNKHAVDKVVETKGNKNKIK
jgi:hypothetical protein